MRAVDLIRKKRDGGELSREEIEFLISGATHERVPDYQMAAFLMAVVGRGMTRAGLAAPPRPAGQTRIHSWIQCAFGNGSVPAGAGAIALRADWADAGNRSSG